MCISSVLHDCPACQGLPKQRIALQRNQHPISPASGNHRAEEELKKRSTAEQNHKSLHGSVSLKIHHLTSEIQHGGTKETAEGTDGKGLISKEQTAQGRMTNWRGRRKKIMENSPKKSREKEV